LTAFYKHQKYNTQLKIYKKCTRYKNPAFYLTFIKIRINKERIKYVKNKTKCKNRNKSKRYMGFGFCVAVNKILCCLNTNINYISQLDETLI